MDIKTITATLALLGTGIPLTACDSGDEPAKEAGKADKKDGAEAKDDVKAKAEEGAEAKGEMACGEGKCGAGACGAKKDDKAMADGESKKDEPTAAAEADEDADKS